MVFRSPMLLVVWVVVVGALGMASGVEAQESRCADCHFANPQAAPNPEHLFDWERSAHGRNAVGCESCHGGDASTFESFIAHQGILTSRNPASPSHRSNLPRTCGKCHIGEFVAFQKSRHFELLSEDRGGDVPSCSTCHGPVAAHLLSPRGLERRCLSCHGEGQVAPNEDYPEDARWLQEEVRLVREILDPLAESIARIEDPERRRELEDAHEQAEVPITEAVQSAHEFVFVQVRERLAVAKERAESLADQLVNP